MTLCLKMDQPRILQQRKNGKFNALRTHIDTKNRHEHIQNMPYKIENLLAEDV